MKGPHFSSCPSPKHLPDWPSDTGPASRSMQMKRDSCIAAEMCGVGKKNKAGEEKVSFPQLLLYSHMLIKLREGKEKCRKQGRRENWRIREREREKESMWHTCRSLFLLSSSFFLLSLVLFSWFLKTQRLALFSHYSFITSIKSTHCVLESVTNN